MLVRYLMGDQPSHADAAQRLLDGDQPLALSLVALAEAAWVLASFYRVPRAELIDGLLDVLAKQHLELIGADKRIVGPALLLCRDSARVNVADALIYADALSHGIATLYSFDRFPSDGLDVRVPSPS